jgi:hypothetical protein
MPSWLFTCMAERRCLGDRFAAHGAKPGSIAASSANYWRIRTGASLAETRRPCRDTNCIDDVSNLFANRSVSRGTNFRPDPSYGAGRAAKRPGLPAAAWAPSPPYLPEPFLADTVATPRTDRYPEANIGRSRRSPAAPVRMTSPSFLTRVRRLTKHGRSTWAIASSAKHNKEDGKRCYYKPGTRD